MNCAATYCELPMGKGTRISKCLHCGSISHYNCWIGTICPSCNNPTNYKYGITTEQEINQKCNKCKEEIKSEEELLKCPDCGGFFHINCWDFYKDSSIGHCIRCSRSVCPSCKNLVIPDEGICLDNFFIKWELYRD